MHDEQSKVGKVLSNWTSAHRYWTSARPGRHGNLHQRYPGAWIPAIPPNDRAAAHAHHGLLVVIGNSSYFFAYSSIRWLEVINAALGHIPTRFVFKGLLH